MTSSPTPHVEASSARSPPVSASPHACALSTQARWPTMQDRAGHGVAERPAHRDRSEVPSERRVQHVDEARPAVRHRREVELVVGCPPAPALRDRAGSLDRR